MLPRVNPSATSSVAVIIWSSAVAGRSVVIRWTLVSWGTTIVRWPPISVSWRWPIGSKPSRGTGCPSIAVAITLAGVSAAAAMWGTSTVRRSLASVAGCRDVPGLLLWLLSLLLLLNKVSELLKLFKQRLIRTGA